MKNFPTAALIFAAAFAAAALAAQAAPELRTPAGTVAIPVPKNFLRERSIPFLFRDAS